MSADLFTRLARRAIGELAVVQPRVDPLLEQPATEQALPIPAVDPNSGVTDAGRTGLTDPTQIERIPAAGLGPAAVGEVIAERPLQPPPAMMVAGATVTTTLALNEPGDSNVGPQGNAATPAGDAARRPAPPVARRLRPIEHGPAATIARPVSMLPAPDRPLPMAAADQGRGDDRVVAPVIDITIDRIEVRTERPVRDHGQPHTARPGGEPKPALPLADYLAQRGR